MSWLGLGTALAGFVQQFWKPIATLFGGLAAYWKGRADARKEARIAADEHALEAHRDRARVDDRAARASDEQLRADLSRWER